VIKYLNTQNPTPKNDRLNPAMKAALPLVGIKKISKSSKKHFKS